MGWFGKRAKRRVLAATTEGARRPVDADAVLARCGDGRELAISFSDHPASRGGVMLRSGFAGDSGGAVPEPEPRAPEIVTGVVLLPSSGNGMNASVWAMQREAGVPVASGGEAPTTVRLTALRAGVPVGEESESFVMEFANGADLTVTALKADPFGRLVALQAGPMWTMEEFQRLQSGGSAPASHLAVQFGGCNVVHVLVPRRRVRICGPGGCAPPKRPA